MIKGKRFILSNKPFLRDGYYLVNNVVETSAFHSQLLLPSDPQFSKLNGFKPKRIRWPSVKRKTWAVVPENAIPKVANILLGRFVTTIKDEGTGRETWNAEFVVHAHRDKLKMSIVRDISVFRLNSIELLIDLASTLRSRIFSTDINQSYLQSEENLQVEVIINLAIKMNLECGNVVKLLWSLYGISESTEYWFRTVRSTLKKKLQIKTCFSNSSLRFKTELILQLNSVVPILMVHFTLESNHTAKNTLNLKNQLNWNEREWNDTRIAGL